MYSSDDKNKKQTVKLEHEENNGGETTVEKKDETVSTVSTVSDKTKLTGGDIDIVEDEALFKTLRQLPFYHGFLPREDLRSLLRHDGDYLIRVSEITTKKEHDDQTAIKRDIILSVFESCPNNTQSDTEFEGKLRNMVVRRYNGKFWIEMTVSFDTILDLLSHYNQSNTSEARRNRILKNPIKLHRWELKHEDIKVGKLLGEGAYGEVRAGTLKWKGKDRDVAIKLTKGNAVMDKVKIREMMKEARLMRAFKHKNIVRFYGVAVDEQPLYIILELVQGGALNTHLQKQKGKTTTHEFLNMCLGAALGLQYLHSNNCIHRDIAARNCLYSVDKIIKLSDFGLSRLGNTYKLASSQKLPIKWLAAETITTLYFTFKTDVYSYGVMCFEIFTEGEEPWDNITNTETKKNVVSGKCLTIPETCPEKLRVFIEEKIYVKNPKRRVNMDDVVRYIEPLINELHNEQQQAEKTTKTVIAPVNTSLKTAKIKKAKSETPKGPVVKKSAHPGNHNIVDK